MLNRIPVFACVLLLAANLAPAEEVHIHVHAREVTNRISPWTTGACIEDVNHEIYGGIYSQMIFGESFQEPAASVPPKGFTAFGGDWQAKDGQLLAGAGDGPKLISDEPAFSTGEVSVDVLFPDKQNGNAALIMKVDRPRAGADDWIGYEIGLDAPSGTLLLGRHRNNWEPIRTVPCPLPLNQWITLTVRVTDKTIAASVNGRPIIEYEDREHPLASGKAGLRTWQRTAQFRNLSIKTGGQTKPIPFESAARTSSGDVSGMWHPLMRGTATGACSLQPAGAFIGTQSQRLTFTGGEGELGIENRGLNRWGMYFVEAKPYDGYLWARAENPTDIIVTLESADGTKVYGEAPLHLKSGDWQRLDFTLTPNATDRAGRFAIKLKQPGSVLLGHAFLEPGAWGRFKGLPVRKDVADALVAQGLTVLRYGGSMVNASEYRWKKMVGPRDRRPPYRGLWYPYSTNGWGIIDFLSFCEAAGFLPVPDFNMDESPGDMADFIEYVNGPADSEWGRRRVQDGHPAPFHLKYLELGNEEAVNDVYWKKFKPLAEAIWAKDPAIVPVVGDFAYNEHIADPYHFKGAPSITSLAAHKQILDFAAAAHKPVWFDVHINNDNPREPEGQLAVLGELIDWLGKISPGADFKICIFEENAGNHALRRGLAHAHAINGLERLGDRVPIVCAANCLQPDGQNDNGWDQGLLFLNPSQVWGQPSYYVTQMVAKNYLPRCVKTDVDRAAHGLDVTARTSEDGRVLTLQVMNPNGANVPAHIHLDGFTPSSPTIHVTEIAGELNDTNTADAPRRIIPNDRLVNAAIEKGEAAYTFPARSFTILRFE
ncbi:MAG: putative alpha-L-arabinofuranosidase [Phycisphaerales bacterium]|nr:putative alpha-L-arabinofuranosidase [Phycisphaerales bacterium]